MALNAAGSSIGRITATEQEVISPYLDSDDYLVGAIACRAIKASSPVRHSSFNGLAVELETNDLLAAQTLGAFEPSTRNKLNYQLSFDKHALNYKIANNYSTHILSYCIH